MTGRTFKCFSRSIELRAYIPNTMVGELPAVVGGVANEIAKVFPGTVVHHDKLQLASNRAGLHLAYNYEPAIAPQIVQGKQTDWQIYQDALKAAATKLEAAGWKMCKGN